MYSALLVVRPRRPATDGLLPQAAPGLVRTPGRAISFHFRLRAVLPICGESEDQEARAYARLLSHSSGGQDERLVRVSHRALSVQPRTVAGSSRPDFLSLLAGFRPRLCSTPLRWAPPKCSALGDSCGRGPQRAGRGRQPREAGGFAAPSSGGPPRRPGLTRAKHETAFLHDSRSHPAISVLLLLPRPAQASRPLRR